MDDILDNVYTSSDVDYLKSKSLDVCISVKNESTKKVSKALFLWLKYRQCWSKLGEIPRIRDGSLALRGKSIQNRQVLWGRPWPTRDSFELDLGETEHQDVEHVEWKYLTVILHNHHIKISPNKIWGGVVNKCL